MFVNSRFSFDAIRYLFLGIIGLIACATACTVWADAEVSVPENMVVTGIDGQDTDSSEFFSRKHTVYRLSAGQHVIKARYDQLFDLGEDHDIVRSKGVAITVQLADQQIYTLGWQPEPDTYDAALKFVKRPTLIMMEGSQLVASQQGAILPSSSILGHIENGIQHLVATSNDHPSLDTMEEQWQNASPEEKKQLQSWIAQQNAK